MSRELTITETSAKPNLRFWLGLVFFIVTCLGLLFGLTRLLQGMMQENVAPVSSLVINGNTPYTQQDEIVAAITRAKLDNFFQLDVNQVQMQIEALPWVYSATVRKQWPNELRVYVEDQKPVAQWNSDFFINEHGTIFQAAQARVQHPLPKLFGPEGSEKTALENYQNLNELLAFIQSDIRELVLTERFAWQLTLSDGVYLNLGREDRVKRLQRYMDAYPQIKAQQTKQQQVDYVDLRYDTGLAVGFKPIQPKEEHNGNA
ncbi:FtsQ-type POTRA domain-containing protein [Thalassotalea litorea]|uniref:Cell division protein FtsQ n=1 Tax=Thalassotalea litorea TaxID=2020715 RepID=A0A5R9IRN9_9GAMM|nr:cell division protein FtsQ/DivIB [Thalassotalea litorea]TLU66727.1 FtsQ-type POTRA domain-containing protein [Thalassotalea litorea]